MKINPLCCPFTDAQNRSQNLKNKTKQNMTCLGQGCVPVTHTQTEYKEYLMFDFQHAIIMI